jgi:hypothetical protein
VVANAKINFGTSGASTVEFVADCPAPVAVDDLVYVTGPEVLGVVQIDTVDITDSGTMPAIGIVVEKPTPITCRVITMGEVTPLLLLTPGKRYFVSVTGGLTAAIPTPGGGNKQMVQVVGYAIATNRLIVLPNMMPVKKLG